MAITCAYHPKADAAGACVNCGRLICTECKVEVGGKIYCNPCVEKMLLDKGEIKSATSEPVTVAATTRKAKQATPETKAEEEAITALSADGNTSGQGKSAVVPQEIKGWSWGAFLLNWIWGIGNSVWIALISLIPIPLIGVIMMFILGAKGNEWAWQSKKWETIEHFKKTQRAWTIAGVILLCIGVALGILVAIISIVVGPINLSMPS